MKRNLELGLTSWKNNEAPLPLLVRGARQVGKSFVIENWGKKHFHNVVSINFEQYPEYAKCFETFVPTEIIHSITALSKQKIEAGQTLLFLDEIQECPKAIQALRYFKEQYPLLHIIGAGSLLEFTLNDAQFRMPVGRVQFVYLKPMSFQEYLFSAGYHDLQKYIKESHAHSKIPEVIHEKLLKLVKEYFVTGGMPAVVNEYLTTQNFNQVKNLQSNLLNTYRHDFGKYASKFDHKYLSKLFEKVPGLVSEHFKFSKVDKDMRSRDLKGALERLCYASIINQVYSTAATGLPLESLKDEKKFKLLFLDVGLVLRAMNLDADIILNDELLLVNRGSLAEQFVGQELLAYTPFSEEAKLFFWSRDKGSSTAQVDYVVTVGKHIIPIEVKAGTTGQLKSMKIFMNEKKSKIGVRISQLPLEFSNSVLSLPLYMISELERIVKSLVK